MTGSSNILKIMNDQSKNQSAEALAEAGLEQFLDPDIKDLGGFSVRRVLPSPSRRIGQPAGVIQSQAQIHKALTFTPLMEIPQCRPAVGLELINRYQAGTDRIQMNIVNERPKVCIAFYDQTFKTSLKQVAMSLMGAIETVGKR